MTNNRSVIQFWAVGFIVCLGKSCGEVVRNTQDRNGLIGDRYK